MKSKIGGIKKLNPHRIFILSTASFMALAIFSPFRSRFDYPISVVSFFAINIFALYIPLFFYSKVFSRRIGEIHVYDKAYWDRHRKRIIWLLNVVIAIASTGVVLRLVDKFLYRGFSLGMSMADGLEMAREDSGSALGVISAFTYPLAISALCLANYVRNFDSHTIGRIKYFYIVLIFFAPAMEVALLGKRGTIMTLAVTYGLISIWFSYSSKGFISRNWRILVAAIVFVAISIILLNLRLKEVDGNQVSMLMAGRVTDLVALSPGMERWLLQLNSWTQSIAAGILGLWVYFTHGIYEFFYLVENFHEVDAKHGGYTFFIVHKFLSMIGVASNYTGPVIMENSLPRAYVYTTLFGPLYVDFLWGSVLFSFVLGATSCFAHYKASKDITYLPLYLQFACVLAFYPMINMLTMFQGLYNIIASIIFLMLGVVFLKIKWR